MPFFVILILIIVGACGIDQLTKWLAYFNSEALENDPINILGLFEITYVENPGMAFGLLADRRWIFLTVSIIGIALISVYLFKWSKDRRLTKIGLALIIGGGIGNMIDRTVLGFVVDMLKMSFLGDFFPWVFNIADSCVCVGVGIAILGIVLDIIKEYKTQKEAKSSFGESNEDKRK